MDPIEKGQKLLPFALGVSMLTVILTAALTPNFGYVAAQSSCPYGNCASGGGSAFPWISVFVALAVILAAIILAMLVLYYRRRSPPPPPAGRTGAVGKSAGGAPPPPPSTGTTGLEEPTTSSPGYIEAAEYFGIPPLGTADTGTWTNQAWTGTLSSAERREALAAEIDSVVMEIDILSSEMLKRN
jgi:hypothetical protein